MNLCEHHDAGVAPAIVRALTFAERKAVIGALLGALTDPPDNLFQKIHDAGHWIACDCLGDRPPPVLHTRRSHTGTYALVRMPGRPAHAPGCPVADGLSDLYEDTITPHLTQQLLEIASASGALRSWHAIQPTPPPTIWTLVSAMARHATSCSVTTGEVVTHPSRLPGLAVRMRQAATSAGAPQVATALIATRSADRGSVTPLAKDAEPVHVRGPIAYLVPGSHADRPPALLPLPEWAADARLPIPDHRRWGRAFGALSSEVRLIATCRHGGASPHAHGTSLGV